MLINATQDFVIVEGLDLKDFQEFIRIAKERFLQSENQIYAIGSLDSIDIELFSSKDGKVYKGTEALYKIIRTEYENESTEIDF